MTIAQNEESSTEELNCYTKILNIFLKVGDDERLKDIWKSRAMLKLMEKLKTHKNKNVVKNALIILLSLFEDVPADLFDSVGSDLENISEKERQEVILKLKEILRF